ncbi:hypothetical protein KI387_038388, partial [Taxus chinensis]
MRSVLRPPLQKNRRMMNSQQPFLQCSALTLIYQTFLPLWKTESTAPEIPTALETQTKASYFVVMEIDGQETHGDDVVRRYQDEISSLKEKLK